MSERSDLLAQCINRAGYRRGARVAYFIREWETCVTNNRADVGVAEFAQWWKDSPRSAYRRIGEFRDTFPELGERATPSDLMRPLLARLEAGQLDNLEALGLALP